MYFEWSEIKNHVNYEKHGVWFEEAQTVWSIAGSIEFYDPEHSAETEDRFIKLGFSEKLNLLVIVFCERSDGHVIRIISARQASLKERVQYEKGI